MRVCSIPMTTTIQYRDGGYTQRPCTKRKRRTNKQNHRLLELTKTNTKTHRTHLARDTERINETNMGLHKTTNAMVYISIKSVYAQHSENICTSNQICFCTLVMNTSVKTHKIQINSCHAWWLARNNKSKRHRTTRIYKGTDCNTG